MEVCKAKIMSPFRYAVDFINNTICKRQDRTASRGSFRKS